MNIQNLLAAIVLNLAFMDKSLLTIHVETQT